MPYAGLPPGEVAPHLAQALRARWLALPQPAPAPLRDAVAAGGTDHAFGLATGAHLVASMAIVLGPAPVGRVELAEVDALPARFADAAASSARDLVMRALETHPALEAIRRAVTHGTAGQTTIWFDGSLFGDLAHMAGGPSVVQWGAAPNVPGSCSGPRAAVTG